MEKLILSRNCKFFGQAPRPRMLQSNTPSTLFRLVSLPRTFNAQSVSVPLDCVEDPSKTYQDRIARGPNYIPPSQSLAPPSPNVKAFALDSLPNYGAICLLYNASHCPSRQFLRPSETSKAACADPSSVWFKDRSCKWWYVAPDVTSYLRLMMVHLCIQGWWLAYTDSGLDPACKLLMRRYAPERMLVDEAFSEKGRGDSE